MKRLLLLLLALSACREGPSVAPPSPDATPPRHAEVPLPDDTSRVVAILERFECARCHDGLPVAPVAEAKHCIHCHQEAASGQIHARQDHQDSGGLASVLPPWRLGVSIDNLLFAPHVQKNGRLRAEWLAHWLHNPQTVRPFVHANMPLLELEEDEIAALARWLGAPAKVDVAAAEFIARADAARGQTLFVARNCVHCHVGLDAPAAAPMFYHKGKRFEPADAAKGEKPPAPEQRVATESPRAHAP